MARRIVFAWLLCLVARAGAENAAAPTFQELMDPGMFPAPQQGMTVEEARREGGVVRLRTTGARIELDLDQGTARFHQRIGHDRAVATVAFGQALSGVSITHSSPGFARITVESPKMTFRLNGDSLFMIHAHEALALPVTLDIAPAWQASFKTSHLIADEWGAVGMYCSDENLLDAYDPYAPTVATYPLTADGVLWVGVCPPKPYDWERSFTDNVVWHWSRELGYPPDDVLRSWKPYGNIVLLQSEVMLWKDWNMAFVPRLGIEEFDRVRGTIHGLDMRFIVYTSPFYFLKGTALEPHAVNTFENFKGWPPGTPTGENMGLFLPEIRKVMREYKPDGLYFDGQYIQNPAALYALAREARAIVGQEGILEWHSTGALGEEQCYLPHADAYVDFILRGEGLTGIGFEYLRFFVSGYNISNSLGVLCNNVSLNMTPQLVADVLLANGRFHTLAGWLNQPDVMEILQNDYNKKLAPALKGAVERGVDERQALVREKAAAVRKERAALDAPPQWEAPAASFEFDSLPECGEVVSKANEDPFSVKDGNLHIKGLAHTCAFLRIPLETKAQGFVVKLRQGTDQGMSWGPAAMLRWPDDSRVRVGTRSDGTLQSDILGRQRLGNNHDPGEWTWLRVRWGERAGVFERSMDGERFDRVWSFTHDGALEKPTAELLVGKVPYNGEAQDHTDPGEAGECAIDFVRVYGDSEK